MALSNHHNCVIAVNNVWYDSSEHAYMAARATFFGATTMANRMAESSNPKDAKKWSKRIKNFDAEEWAKVRMNRIARVLFAKFGQIPEIQTALIETEPSQLYECSFSDEFWGTGSDLADFQAGRIGNGKNMLGKMLEVLWDRYIVGSWISELPCDLPEAKLDEEAQIFVEAVEKRSRSRSGNNLGESSNPPIDIGNFESLMVVDEIESEIESRNRVFPSPDDESFIAPHSVGLMCRI